MKVRYSLLTVLVTSFSVLAGSQPASLQRNFMFESSDLSIVTIGVDAQKEERTILGKNSADTLTPDIRWASFFVGLDITPYCTFFATVGGVEVRAIENNSTSDSSTRWSAGINFNLWNYRLKEPSFLDGRISIKSSLEVAGFNADFEKKSISSIEWREYSFAFPVSYEVYSDMPEEGLHSAYSIVFYAGPAFSKIDGNIKKNGSKMSVKSDKDFGVIGGIDIFLAENLSIGVRGSYFDESSFGGSIRLHF